MEFSETRIEDEKPKIGVRDTGHDALDLARKQLRRIKEITGPDELNPSGVLKGTLDNPNEISIRFDAASPPSVCYPKYSAASRNDQATGHEALDLVSNEGSQIDWNKRAIEFQEKYGPNKATVASSAVARLPAPPEEGDVALELAREQIDRGKVEGGYRANGLLRRHS
jgi:hypothetical protein